MGFPTTMLSRRISTKRVSRILAKYNKRMIGWDEILHPDLPAGTLVQSWRGQASLAEAARSGFDGILSFGYYLDHMFPASFHAGVDPLGDADLTERQRARILGGEACMWGELITSENIDGRIWPRAAAVAERLWSSPNTGNIADLYVRLARLSRYLDQIGMQHESSRRRMLSRLGGRSSRGTARDSGGRARTGAFLRENASPNLRDRHAAQPPRRCRPPRKPGGGDISPRLETTTRSERGSSSGKETMLA